MLFDLKLKNVIDISLKHLKKLNKVTLIKQILNLKIKKKSSYIIQL